MRTAFPIKLASFLLLGAGTAFTVRSALVVVESHWDQQDVPAIAPVHTGRERFEPGFTGRISFPRLHAGMLLVDERTDPDFIRGPGFIEGSSRPGERGNSIVAGHRDLHFRLLKDVLIGDEVVVSTATGSYKYRIVSKRVVKPRDTEVLHQGPPDQLILITCYPFYFIGPAPKRFVVNAVKEETSELSSRG